MQRAIRHQDWWPDCATRDIDNEVPLVVRTDALDCNEVMGNINVQRRRLPAHASP